MRTSTRWGVLLLAIACEREAPVDAPAEATPVVDQEPVVEAAPPLAPGPEPECDEGDGTLAYFNCLANRLCPEQNTDDRRVDMIEFLCVARGVQTPDDGPIRMGDVLAKMPARFLHNFTLKHGTRESGLRGHPQEIMADVVHRELAKRSQSADLDFPRLMMWDESTGFTISYNGGLTTENGGTREQTGGDRLDLMGWDDDARTFELWALDIPVQLDGQRAGAITPYQPHDKDDNCTHCHGPDSRPIWPMYPDWPGFYGSDNDELTNTTKHQRAEKSFLAYFRRCVATGEVSRADRCRSAQDAALSRLDPAPRTEADKVRVLGNSFVDARRRYDVLFGERSDKHLAALFEALDVDEVRSYLTELEQRLSASTLKKVRSPKALAASNGTDAELRAWLGLTMHDAYPYRPNHSEHSAEASRAFFHRPNLRLGVLYNRLIARQLHAKIRAHANYRGYEKLFAFALMDCDWKSPDSERPAALVAFEDTAGGALKAAGMRLTPAAHPARILYPALLAAVGLTVRDVDMRYSYPNKRFERFGRDYTAANVVENVMALGYLAYGPSDHNRHNSSPFYFNSYWDGSATLNELLIAMVLEDIAAEAPEYRGLYELRSLTSKYQRFKTRYPLDKAFFDSVDAMGKWFPTPYPKRLSTLHHREPFGKKKFTEQYRAVCSRLATDLVAEHPS